MSTSTRPTSPARANAWVRAAWVRHVEAQPSSGPTRPAMPEHYVIEFPDGSVVRAIPKPTGGPVPDCCDHLAAEGGDCTDCLNTGHAHDPAKPCPPETMPTSPPDARTGAQGTPGGPEVSEGADGASVRSLGDRLRAAADYQDRPGAYDELRAMADEADRLEVERTHHERGARAEYAANARLAGELEQADAALGRVRALHQHGPDHLCTACSEQHPCPTIAALDGGTEADR